MRGVPMWLWIFLMIVIQTMPSNAACGHTNLQNKKSCRGEMYDTFPSTEEYHNESFQTLDMGNNNLKSLNTTGFSDWTYRDRIERVVLDSNHLSNIPRKAFNELRSLRELEFSNNNFTYIGTELCHLQNVTSLSFNNNPIKGFNSRIFKCLPNLKYMSMRNISMSNMPENFLNGSHLEELDLTNNYIENINNIYVPQHISLKYSPRNGGATVKPTKNVQTTTTPGVETDTHTPTTISTKTITTISTKGTTTVNATTANNEHKVMGESPKESGVSVTIIVILSCVGTMLVVVIVTITCYRCMCKTNRSRDRNYANENDKEKGEGSYRLLQTKIKNKIKKITTVTDTAL